MRNKTVLEEKVMRFLLVLLTLHACSALCLSTTLNVPADYRSIQEAIHQAVDRDTVLVAPGLYVENINFLGKRILLQSSDGASRTIIDGNASGSVVTFENGEDSTAVLVGFTLTNGLAQTGGGICCSNKTSPTLINNIIERNMAYFFGGGISCYRSSPLISNNDIRLNTTLDPYGGGGGISCRYFAEPVIENNLIRQNSAGSSGGGLHGEWCDTLVIRNNIVSNNKVLISTKDGFYGGGFHLAHVNVPKLDGNTLSGNIGFHGGGISCIGSTSATIRNSILWDNTAPSGKEIWIHSSGPYAAKVSIHHCNVKGGAASVFVGPGCTLDWGQSMIDADPLFADVDAGDYHLTYESPCRDAGDDSIPGLPSLDFEGDPRIAIRGVDIGADEFHTHLYYSGEASVGNLVHLHLVGIPGTLTNGLWVADELMTFPLPNPYGDWWLEFPVIPLGPLPPIPSKGIFTLTGKLPANPNAPYTVALQALIGDALTNPCVLQVD